MRIIAGNLKNRKLTAPKGMDTRPTSGKMREALFNILQHGIEGAVFLDLFAGSGVMGIEALSRGAERAVFVEKGREAAQSISENIANLDLKEKAVLIKGDVFRVLENIAGSHEKFDLIYADPPYSTPSESRPLSVKAIEIIDAGGLLVKGGSLFIEESNTVDFSALALKTLKLSKERTYGRSKLFHFFNGEEL